MAQRVAILINGESIGALKALGWELDYPLVLKQAARVNHGRACGGIDRNIVLARVYLKARENAGAGWRRFTGFLRDTGYRSCFTDEGRASMHMMHDLLVYALTGRIDAAILIWGDSSTMAAGYERAIQTAEAHGVQVETWALHANAGNHREMEWSRDLENTALLRPARGS
jgi:hypothetical protein